MCLITGLKSSSTSSLHMQFHKYCSNLIAKCTWIRDTSNNMYLSNMLRMPTHCHVCPLCNGDFFGQNDGDLRRASIAKTNRRTALTVARYEHFCAL